MLSIIWHWNPLWLMHHPSAGHIHKGPTPISPPFPISFLYKLSDTPTTKSTINMAFYSPFSAPTLAAAMHQLCRTCILPCMRPQQFLLCLKRSMPHASRLLSPHMCRRCIVRPMWRQHVGCRMICECAVVRVGARGCT